MLNSIEAKQGAINFGRDPLLSLLLFSLSLSRWVGNCKPSQAVMQVQMDLIEGQEESSRWVAFCR